MEEKELKEYGKLIARLRRSLGLSQKELADKAGMTQANVARIEKGRYSPGLSVLNRLEKTLKIKKTYLNENNIMVADNNSTLNIFTLTASEPRAFYEAIRDLPCFSMVSISKDEEVISAVWNDDYKFEYFTNPMQELDYLLAKNELDWPMGSESENIDGRYWCETIDLSGNEKMTDYIKFDSDNTEFIK